MAEWDKQQVGQVLAQMTEVIDQTRDIGSQLMLEFRDNASRVRDDIAELHAMFEELTPLEMASSRRSPWITRSQCQSILTLLRRLKTALDLSTLIKMSGELTTQTKVFMECVDRYERNWGKDAREEGDWDTYLTHEQLLTIATWVDAAKAERLDTYRTVALDDLP